jgi:hypothetical protein
MDCVHVPFRGWMGKTKDFKCKSLWIRASAKWLKCKCKCKVPFEMDMVVDARRTSLCQELQRCWVFCFSHNSFPCVSTVGGRGVQLNNRKAFLMFCTLSVQYLYKTFTWCCKNVPRIHFVCSFIRLCEQSGGDIPKYMFPKHKQLASCVGDCTIFYFRVHRTLP